MRDKLGQIVDIIKSDPAVENVIGFTGGGGGGSGTTTNTARMFIALTPLAERKLSADQVIGRLRPRLATGGRRADLPAGGAGSCESAAGRATRSTSSRCRATASRI